MSYVRAVAVIGMVILLSGAGGESQEPKSVMTPIKYDGLKQEVLRHRGKVLIVDFWGGG